LHRGLTEHGGWIAADSTVGRGIHFAISLSQATAQPDSAVA
jgi:hypothetical protein